MMKSQKKIGLVTLYDGNFGSILQCFSTKRFLESLDQTCDVLCLNEDENLLHVEVIKRKLKTLLKILSNLFFLKFIIKSKLNMIKNSLSKNTEMMMNSFIADFIKPKKIDQCLLKKKEWLDGYKYFIAGSDQIWNVAHLVKPFNFLQFAPRNKRISLAVSFGISEIPLCNQRELSVALNGFDYISVREESGAEIVKKYSKAKISRIADPTFIYNAEEWRFFCKDAKIVKKNYILVHFLDKPNNVAIDSINWLSAQTNLDVVVVGYKHESLNSIANLDFVDANPWDYVSLIERAAFVLTDSFHTSLFSINFEKKFFVFHRGYSVLNQTCRISDLLNRFEMQNRLISDAVTLKINYMEKQPKESRYILEKERRAIRDYIEKSVFGKIPSCFE